MEQLGKDLEKVLKAGIGAVKSGVEQTQDLIDNWAEKGEPIYEAAKASVCATAGKINKHMECCPQKNQNESPAISAEDIKKALKSMDKDELDDVLSFIGKIYMDAKMAKDDGGEARQSLPMTESPAPSPAPHP